MRSGESVLVRSILCSILSLHSIVDLQSYFQGLAWRAVEKEGALRVDELETTMLIQKWVLRSNFELVASRS
jgi:hypothetical protein